MKFATMMAAVVAFHALGLVGCAVDGATDATDAVDDESDVETSQSALIRLPGYPYYSPPTATVINGHRVDLKWSLNREADIAGYRIYRNGVALKTLAHPTSTYSDTTVVPNTNYSYQFTAFDKAGNESTKTAAITVRPVLKPFCDYYTYIPYYGGWQLWETRSVDWTGKAASTCKGRGTYGVSSGGGPGFLETAKYVVR